mgnify:CR=1 FL=1
MEFSNRIIEDLTLIVGSGTLAFFIALAFTPWFKKQLIKFNIIIPSNIQLLYFLIASFRY